MSGLVCSAGTVTNDSGSARQRRHQTPGSRPPAPRAGGRRAAERWPVALERLEPKGYLLTPVRDACSPLVRPRPDVDERPPSTASEPGTRIVAAETTAGTPTTPCWDQFDGGRERQEGNHGRHRLAGQAASGHRLAPGATPARRALMAAPGRRPVAVAPRWLRRAQRNDKLN
jgi:hypothetical protein